MCTLNETQDFTVSILSGRVFYKLIATVSTITLYKIFQNYVLPNLNKA